MESSINFFSLNVGMNASLAGLSTLIVANSLDIIFLQEVRLSSEQIELLLGGMGYQAAVNIDRENPSKPGTAIVWKKSIPLTDISSIVLCRAQVATLGRYKLLNIYAPSGSDKIHEWNAFFGDDIFTMLGLNHNPTWVLGGDFNCVLKAIDIEGGFGFAQKFCPALKDLIKAVNLKDVFRSSYPRLEEYTFFRAGKAPSRLDRFYLCSEIFESLTAVSHVASLSDHCGVKMILKLDIEKLDIHKPKRSTYWKLNNSILVEEDFMSSFALFWRKILRSKIFFVDTSEWWDKHAKPEIKKFCIGYSINRKIQRNQTKQYLLSYLKLALADKDWNEVARVKGKLYSMLQADAQGVVVRSRFQTNSEEERASLFHAARELKNSKNNLSSLKIGGTNVKDEGIIEAEVVREAFTKKTRK
jgi:exonuclease III